MEIKRLITTGLMVVSIIGALAILHLVGAERQGIDVAGLAVLLLAMAAPCILSSGTQGIDGDNTLREV